MYKLLNLLFGWDYIYWTNTCDWGVSRIRKTPNGVIWYYRYKVTDVIDTLKKPNDVIWLTCHPSKYYTKINNQLNKIPYICEL